MDDKYKKLFVVLWHLLKSTKSSAELFFIIPMGGGIHSITQKEFSESDFNQQAYYSKNVSVTETMKKELAEFANEVFKPLLYDISEKLHNMTRYLDVNQVDLYLQISQDRQITLKVYAEATGDEEHEEILTEEDGIEHFLEMIEDLNPNEPLTRGRVEFSGYGDSGSIDDTIYTDDGNFTIPQDVLEWMYTQLPGGWEINEGSDGEFFFDFVKREIRVLLIDHVEEEFTDTVWETKF